MADCPLPPGSLVWAYCRHSPGDEQDIQSQVRAVEDYCRQHGLVIAHIFQDIARVGWSVAGRDGFQLMIRTAQQEPRPVDGIVFWSYSRFSRDIDDAPYFRAMLRRMGYVPISITEPIPDTLMGRAFEAMIDVINASDRERKSLNVRRGLHDRVRQGFSAGGPPPVGYLAEKIQIGQKTGGAPKYGTRWVPDPDRFHLAQRAWEMRSDGATYAEIHRAIPFYSDAKCWYHFFQNKAYLGIQQCGDIEVPDAHPTTCTLEQWDRVQAMRQPYRAGGAYPRRVSSPFLLSGLAECQYCGGPVSGSSSGSGARRWRYYICSRKPNQGWHLCEAQSLATKKVDRAVVAAVLDAVLTPAHLYDLIEAVNEELSTDQNGLDLDLAQKRAELNRAQATVQNLLYAISRGSLSATDELLKEEKKQARLAAELKLLERKAAQERIIVDEEEVRAKLDQMRHALAAFTSDDPDIVKSLRAFLQNILSRVVLGSDGGTIHYHLPLVILPRNQTETLQGILPIASHAFTY